MTGASDPAERRRAIQAHLAENDAKVQAMTGVSDDVQAGVVVTEADRATAMRVMAWEPLDYETFANAVNNGHHPDDRDTLETVDAIATALAAERAKAREPFLAALNLLDSDKSGLPEFAWAIRHAAQNGQ